MQSFPLAFTNPLSRALSQTFAPSLLSLLYCRDLVARSPAPCPPEPHSLSASRRLPLHRCQTCDIIIFFLKVPTHPHTSTRPTFTASEQAGNWREEVLGESDGSAITLADVLWPIL